MFKKFLKLAFPYIVLEVDFKAENPFIKIFVVKLLINLQFYGIKSLVINFQLDEIFKKYPQEVGLDVPSFLLY
jgi:hypothetical protein